MNNSSREKNSAFFLLASMLFMLCMSVFLYAFTQTDKAFEVSSQGRIYLVEFLGAIEAVVICVKTHVTLDELCLRRSYFMKGWKVCILSIILIVILLIAVKILLRGVNVSGLGINADAPFVDWKRMYCLIPYKSYYPFEILMQEFMARSVMQLSLMRVYNGPARCFVTLLLTSMFFGALHIGLGFYYMLGAALLMFVFGFFFYKSRNLVATCLVHYCLAGAALVLGLW